MAKRFTDSDKWKKQWFRCLPPTWKCFWIYVCDNCDHAGIWDVDLDLASFQIGAKLDASKVSEILGKQILEISNGKKWFIVDFIDFQYGELKSNNNAHASVIAILTRFGLWDFYLNRNNLAPCEPLMSPLGGALDMDMDKDQDMDKEKKGDARGKQKSFERDDVWFKDPEFEKAWDGWEEMRKASKAKPTDQARKLALEKLKSLAGEDIEMAIKIINASIESNWKSFFELKGNHGTNKSQPFKSKSEREWEKLQANLGLYRTPGDGEKPNNQFLSLS